MHAYYFKCSEKAGTVLTCRAHRWVLAPNPSVCVCVQIHVCGLSSCVHTFMLVRACAWPCGNKYKYGYCYGMHVGMWRKSRDYAYKAYTIERKVKHSYREISQFNACLHNPILVVVVRRLSDFSVLCGWHFSPLMYWYRFHSSAQCLASPRSYHISGDNEPSRDIPDRGTPSYSPSTNKHTHLSWPAHPPSSSTICHPGVSYTAHPPSASPNCHPVASNPRTIPRHDLVAGIAAWSSLPSTSDTGRRVYQDERSSDRCEMRDLLTDNVSLHDQLEAGPIVNLMGFLLHSICGGANAGLLHKRHVDILWHTVN